MTYSDSQIQEIIDARRDIIKRSNDLTVALITRTSSSSGRSSEFTRHGICRRLKLIEHLIKRVDETIPLSETEPEDYALLDCTAFLHAFIVNVFGAIDNLAWVWCLEANIKGSNGKPISSTHVGLRPKNTLVRQSLSPSLRLYLTTTDAWFEYLENYRHSLAHRVPFYIPPRQLNPDAQRRFRELDSELSSVLGRKDFKRWGEILDEQGKLGVFDPLMIHSFEENSRPIRFHPQMICDLATVVEIGERMIGELASLP